MEIDLELQAARAIDEALAADDLARRAQAVYAEVHRQYLDQIDRAERADTAAAKLEADRLGELDTRAAGLVRKAERKRTAAYSKLEESRLRLKMEAAETPRKPWPGRPYNRGETPRSRRRA